MMQAKMITPDFLAAIMGVGHSCITGGPFGALFMRRTESVALVAFVYVHGHRSDRPDNPLW